MSFSGKVALVTGASSGIGAATAKHFAREGANVVIVGRNQAKLANVAADINKLGKEPLVIQADVSKTDDARRIIKETISKFGKIDILVNNAGLVKLFTILSDNVMEKFDQVMATNLRAVVQMTNLAGPHLIKVKGNIVNISSIAAHSVMRLGYSAYITSKAALSHFSRGAALEFADYGVRVNIVSPGPVVTDILENAGMHRSMELNAPYLPLKRVSMPDEVADLVLFLASEKAKGITGSDFVTDNGTLLISLGTGQINTKI